MKGEIKQLAARGLLALSLGLNACQTTPGAAHSPAPAPKSVGAAASADRGLAILWFQAAAEARALYFQAYNIARARLDDALARRQGDEKLAVIMDIDETILDNSPLEASLAKSGRSFSQELWKEWGEQGKAQALPGAQAFLTYAVSKKVEVFYVSNRNLDEFDATARNLKAQNFPTVDAEHLLLQRDKEGKEPRRRELGARYKVVLLMGDNLDDFSGIFEKQSAAARFQLTDENREKFGQLFIVLPNPMYGSWENCLYPQGLTEAQKANLRRELLQSWP